MSSSRRAMMLIIFPLFAPKNALATEVTSNSTASVTLVYARANNESAFFLRRPITRRWGLGLQNRTRVEFSERFTLFSDVQARLDSHNRNNLSDSTRSSGDASLEILEIYSTYSFVPVVSFSAGKILNRWGTATLYNPLDVLARPKNVVDPSQENRPGSWGAKTDAVIEDVSITLAGAVETKDNRLDIPSEILTKKYAAGLRLARTFSGTDLTLAGFYRDAFRHDFSWKWQGGLATSTLITDATEFHFEGLGFKGGARKQVGETSLFQIHAVSGIRVQLKDDSIVSAEALYFSDGDSRSQYADRFRAAELLKSNPTSGALQPASDEKATANPFLRKWYGSFALQNYKFLEDLVGGVPVVFSFHDFSGVVTPKLTWTPEQWLSLSLLTTQYFSTMRTRLSGVRMKQTAEFSMAPLRSSFGAEFKAYF